MMLCWIPVAELRKPDTVSKVAAEAAYYQCLEQWRKLRKNHTCRTRTWSIFSFKAWKGGSLARNARLRSLLRENWEKSCTKCVFSILVAWNLEEAMRRVAESRVAGVVSLSMWFGALCPLLLGCGVLWLRFFPNAIRMTCSTFISLQIACFCCLRWHVVTCVEVACVIGSKFLTGRHSIIVLAHRPSSWQAQQAFLRRGKSLPTLPWATLATLLSATRTTLLSATLATPLSARTNLSYSLKPKRHLPAKWKRGFHARYLPNFTQRAFRAWRLSTSM